MNDKLIKQKLDEIDKLLLEVKNLRPIKDVKRVIIAEKRRSTILKKRKAKEAKQQVNEAKFTSKHPDIFTKIKDESNVKPFAKVIRALKKDHKDIRFYNTGARYKGRDVFGLNITQKMTQHDILATANKLSNILGAFDNEGLLDLSVRGDRWYYQGQTKFGGHVQFHDDYDELNKDSFDELAIYISAMPGKKGGSSDSNDCLYACLYEVLGSKILKTFSKASELKRFLKLLPYDKVPISCIELVEKKLNCSINVSGDYTYTSKLRLNKVINLKLINEHYSLDDDKKKSDILKVNYKISRRDRKIMMFDKKTFTGYDGHEYIPFTKEFKYQIYNWKTNYILVNMIDKQKSLKENYDIYIQIADTLKLKTNCKINLYRSGEYHITALHLFSEMTKHIINPDIITQVESEFINKASQGAIYFTTKGYEGEAWKADIKSMYPSLLNSSMLFPVKAGELKYITELPQIIYNGIYRCIIQGNTRLFRFNKDNYYTSIDLNRANELNLKIDLVIDDKPNFLYYSRDKCLTGSELFGEYVNFLFPLKDQKTDGVASSHPWRQGVASSHLWRQGAKQILNILWGSLSQKDENNFVHKHNEKFDIPDDCKVTLKPYDDKSTIISIIKYNHYYKYGWARIMPFLISKGRSVISKIMAPFIDSIVRCHTDGVIFNKEPKGIKYGLTIGDLVDEGYTKQIKIDKSGYVTK